MTLLRRRTPEAAPAAAAPPGTPLLVASELHLAIDGNEILRGVSVDVHPGEIVGLVGPNGAGKSTLLRAVTRVLPFQRGTVRVDGRDLGALSRLDLARVAAVVQQLPEAPGTMRVEDLVLLGRHPHLPLLGRESAHDLEVARDAMRRAGCDALWDRELSTLSGGQRRRAFIARALAQQPRLLMLDEPTANLDPHAQSEIFELLRDLAADGVGVLVVVHDLTLASAYCDRLALLDAGRVVAAGPPLEVVTNEHIRRVYGDRVAVVPHPATGVPLVVPSILTDDREV